jgi:hypothetical protein
VLARTTTNDPGEGRIVPVPPPNRLEVFFFWTTGLVVTILSGAVAVYASHFHLWE